MEEDKQIKLYDELLPYVRYLSLPFQSGDILVEREDVIAELLVELVKCYKRYQDKPYLDILKMTKRAMFYRTKELRYRYYVTSRKESSNNYELDHDFAVDSSDDAPGLHETLADDSLSQFDRFAGDEFIQILLSRVGETAQSVAKLLLDPSERLMEMLNLSAMRADYVYKGGCKKIAIKPYHIADALLVDEEQVISSYEELCSEIQLMYNEGL